MFSGPVRQVDFSANLHNREGEAAENEATSDQEPKQKVSPQQKESAKEKNKKSPEVLIIGHGPEAYLHAIQLAAGRIRVLQGDGSAAASDLDLDPRIDLLKVNAEFKADPSYAEKLCELVKANADLLYLAKNNDRLKAALNRSYKEQPIAWLHNLALVLKIHLDEFFDKDGHPALPTLTDLNTIYPGTKLIVGAQGSDNFLDKVHPASEYGGLVYKVHIECQVVPEVKKSDRTALDRMTQSLQGSLIQEHVEQDEKGNKFVSFTFYVDDKRYKKISDAINQFGARDDGLTHGTGVYNKLLECDLQIKKYISERFSQAKVKVKNHSQKVGVLKKSGQNSNGSYVHRDSSGRVWVNLDSSNGGLPLEREQFIGVESKQLQSMVSRSRDLSVITAHLRTLRRVLAEPRNDDGTVDKIAQNRAIDKTLEDANFALTWGVSSVLFRTVNPLSAKPLSFAPALPETSAEKQEVAAPPVTAPAATPPIAGLPKKPNPGANAAIKQQEKKNASPVSPSSSLSVKPLLPETGKELKAKAAVAALYDDAGLDSIDDGYGSGESSGSDVPSPELAKFTAFEDLHYDFVPPTNSLPLSYAASGPVSASGSASSQSVSRATGSLVMWAVEARKKRGVEVKGEFRVEEGKARTKQRGARDPGQRLDLGRATPVQPVIISGNGVYQVKEREEKGGLVEQKVPIAEREAEARKLETQLPTTSPKRQLRIDTSITSTSPPQYDLVPAPRYPQTFWQYLVSFIERHGKKFLLWGSVGFMVGGLVAGCLFPPAAIPFCMLIGWLIGANAAAVHGAISDYRAGPEKMRVPRESNELPSPISPTFRDDVATPVSPVPIPQRKHKSHSASAAPENKDNTGMAVLKDAQFDSSVARVIAGFSGSSLDAQASAVTTPSSSPPSSPRGERPTLLTGPSIFDRPSPTSSTLSSRSPSRSSSRFSIERQLSVTSLARSDLSTPALSPYNPPGQPPFLVKEGERGKQRRHSWSVGYVVVEEVPKLSSPYKPESSNRHR